MADDTSLWIGESEEKYHYYVFERHPDVPSRMGIFIYSKKNHEDLWVPLYIGHGDLAVRAAKDPALMAKIEEKGATHVHLRLRSMESDREAEIADLLKRYKNAYEPDGVHVRPPE